MLTALYIIAIILVFGAIIIFHEAGHFFFAKLFRMGVHEFAAGMGPLLAARKRGSTQYSLRAVPIGGYVRLSGVEPGDEDATDGFNTKSVWARVAVIAAGPIMNIVLAFLIFFIIYTVIGIPSVATPRIKSVIAGKAADKAGMKAGDRIISVAGVQATLPSEEYAQIRASVEKILAAPPAGKAREQAVNDLIAKALANQTTALANVSATSEDHKTYTSEVTVALRGVMTDALDEVGKHPKKRAEIVKDVMESVQIVQLNALRQAIEWSPKRTIPVVLERNGKELTLMVTPDRISSPVTAIKDKKGDLVDLKRKRDEKGQLGILFASEKTIRVRPDKAFLLGLKATWKSLSQLGQGFKFMLDRKITVGEGVGGPVQIVHIMYNEARTSWSSLLEVAGMISVTIAVMNLIPFPALDGSRIAFILLGAVMQLFGRKLDTRKEEIVHQIGLAVLLVLVLVITVKDVWGLFNPQ
jgi:regulator of sigma E protease